MNKEGVRHRDRSEDDTTPLLPSYESTVRLCTEERADPWTKPPTTAHDKTVFEAFPPNGSSRDSDPPTTVPSRVHVTSLTSGSSGVSSLDQHYDSITDHQRRVEIDYKAKTHPIHTITHFGRNEVFKGLNGIAINKFGEMLVSDRYHNRIMCFDQTLRTCHTVGGNWAWLWSKDAHVHSFNWPSGLASDSEGHFYVADRYNHCIKEFAIRNVNLEFISKLGSIKGSENGYFNEPRGLAFSSKENKLYIADGCNNRIQVFRNRTYLAKFGCAGSEHGQFDVPCSVAISNDDTRLFISDNGNDRVQIFTTSGHFEQQVVHSDLQFPHGICVTPDNHFIVSSAGHNCVLVFKIRGTDEPEHVMTIQGRWKGGEHFNRPGDIVVTNSGHIVIASYAKVLFY